MLISNPQSHLQSQNLETILFCIVVLCFLHNNIASIHMCDEWKGSDEPNVCHMLLSILWPHEQVCSLNREISGLPIRAKYKLFRTIWEHLFDKSPTDFKLFLFRMVVIDAGSRCFVELLSRLVCHLTISFHTFLRMTFHIIRPRVIRRFSEYGSFSVLLRKFPIQTWFCNCPQYLCLFHIVFECSPSIHDQGKMLVLPNRLVCWVISTSDLCFVSFQPIWCHPHTQIRRTLFDGVRTCIPNWKPFPNRTAIGFSLTAFPIIVLLKDDRCWFRILKVTCKVRILKQSYSALLCCVSHITICLIFTCVMNVRYKSIQAFVTGLSPFCDRSCELVYWP